MSKFIRGIVVSAAAMTLAGCESSSQSSDVLNLRPVSVDGSKILLADEPDGAVGVIEARESAEDGASIVVVGRVGGRQNPWIDGRAAFTMLDASMAIVAEGQDDEEGEICTGDCCAAERAVCTTLVKIVDGDGKLIAADSRQLLGLTEDDTVVIRGKAKKDKLGNFVVLADGVYIRR